MKGQHITDWARDIGVHPQTAYRWYRLGTMPVPTIKVGNSVLVLDPAESKTEGLGLYARVSSQDQRQDLDRQATRLATYAATTNIPIARIETEIGSGMNGERVKVQRLLADPAVSTVVVEHRDRLGRMNIGLVEAALRASGRKLVILDDTELEDDLVRDMVEILTSFCARLYGRRTARNRALRAIESAQTNPDHGADA